VANCADLQADLNGVTTVAGLNNIIRTTAQPWGSNLTTPLLMYGAATALHDFEANRTLDHVTLTRTVAKLELNITPHRPTPEKAVIGAAVAQVPISAGQLRY